MSGIIGQMKAGGCLLAMLVAALVTNSVEAGGYTMEPVRWGDSDCDNDVTAGDVRYVLTYLAGVPDPPPPPARCPTIGDVAPVIIYPRVWGDVDCSGGVTPGDGLEILLYLSDLPGLPTATPTMQPVPTGTIQPPPCPFLGDEVSLNDATPTPSPTPSPTPAN